MVRSDGRKNDQIRPIKIIKDYLKYPDGSVLIEAGETKVICSATFQEGVPFHRKGSGSGWLTAEYSMIPGSSAKRVQRETKARIKGRTQEIQRLVGRVLRAVVDLDALGENTILIDTDVIQADGGTRTAAITGSFVALYNALDKKVQEKQIKKNPIKEYLAATSVGIVSGVPMLDLAYVEDVSADVDMNIVMTESGKLVEIQGTAEGEPFSKEDLDALIDLGAKGVSELIKFQQKAIKDKP